MLKLFYAITSGALCTAFLGASLTGWQIFSLNTHHFRARSPLGVPFMRTGQYHK
jgi:hypothetical protein